MTEQAPSIRPLFHYTYRNDGVILDQQYNYQGNLLAACNSNGEIFFYSAESEEQNREPVYSNDRKRGNERKNAAILKVAWSLPIFGYFATVSISREIDLFTCNKSSITEIMCRKVDYIPLSIAFCPVESEVVLAVGLSDGSVMMLNEQLEQVALVLAHQEAVNCVAWDHKILAYEKNKWITSNFSHVRKIVGLDEPPLLITGSSDSWVKLWRWEGGKLTELYRLKTHEKAVREVQWRPNYFFDSQRFVISCSQDGSVSIWRLKGNKLQLKETHLFGGPVYKANFNYLGNMIAISYCNDKQERIETVIMKEKDGTLMGENIEIYS